MQLAAKIRRDLLIVDSFWKTFLQKHGSTVGTGDKKAKLEPPEVIETQSSFATPVDSIFGRAKVVIERIPSPAMPIEEVKVESYEVTSYEHDYNDFDDYDDENDLSALEEDRLELQTNENASPTSNKPKDTTVLKYVGVKPMKGELKHFKCAEVECADGKL